MEIKFMYDMLLCTPQDFFQNSSRVTHSNPRWRRERMGGCRYSFHAAIKRISKYFCIGDVAFLPQLKQVLLSRKQAPVTSQKFDPINQNWERSFLNLMKVILMPYRKLDIIKMLLAEFKYDNVPRIAIR